MQEAKLAEKAPLVLQQQSQPLPHANRDAVSSGNLPVPRAKFGARSDRRCTRRFGSTQEHPNSAEVVRSLVSAEKTISITGELKYRACDTAICYPPNQCL